MSRPLVHEAEYGTFRQEILDPESELYGFRPDFLILATLLERPGPYPGIERRSPGGGPKRSRPKWRTGRGFIGRLTSGWVARSSRTISICRRGARWEIMRRAIPSGFARYVSLVNLAPAGCGALFCDDSRHRPAWPRRGGALPGETNGSFITPSSPAVPNNSLIMPTACRH